MKRGKKAVSAIIATVLLILLTVAAAGVLYSFMVPLIRGTIETADKCNAAQLEIIEGEDTCYSSSQQNVSVEVGRGGQDVELNGIRILVSGKDKSKSVIARSSSLPGKNEARVYIISTSDLGTAPEKVSIAALVNVSGKDRLCETTSQTYLAACSKALLVGERIQ